MRHYRIAIVTIAALLPGVAPGLAAQEVRIQGRVIEDETLQPIAGAAVQVFRPGGRQLGQVFTDDAGNFVFTVPESGGYRFRAARIGYEETETPVLWTDGYEDYQVEIRLAPDAVLLAPIEVLTRSRGEDSPVLESFWARKEAGLGHYFTQDDVRELKPLRVTDLIGRIPGVKLQSSGSGLRRVVYMSRAPTNCPALIYVDGMLWNRPVPDGSGGGDYTLFTVDDVVDPAGVLGVEVYPGLATVPAEFLAPGARCGVVAIWTRR